MMKTLLSPKSMATAIGVSESSLRRWADQGKIAMVKTGGGHRRIQVTEALRFIRETGTPVFRPDILGLSDVDEVEKRPEVKRASQATDVQEITETLQRVLVEGDAAMVRGMLIQLYLDNWPLAQIFDGPLCTAMAHIGVLWTEDGVDGIMVEHRATEICYQAIQHLQALQMTLPEQAPVAIGGTPSGDRHGLGSLVAATTLHDLGFDAINLGTDTPTDVLLAAIERNDVSMAWRSIASPMEEAALADDLSRLAEAMIARGGYLVCGGQHCTASAVPRNPSVIRVGSMTELVAYARGVLASVSHLRDRAAGMPHRSAG